MDGNSDGGGKTQVGMSRWRDVLDGNGKFGRLIGLEVKGWRWVKAGFSGSIVIAKRRLAIEMTCEG